MARIQAIRGTEDRFGSELVRWRTMEERVRAVMERAGYEEIRTPVFEATELFSRSIGTDTDIVQKEMYTFTDRKGRSITLRPEGTASVVRAFLEHHMARERPVAKLYYMGPMFRYERPQKGRLRQFHQYGVEVIGSEDPFYDAETIAVFHASLRELGFDDLTVRLGSVGDGACRPAYVDLLTRFLLDRAGDLSELSRERLERNPLRVLDSKEEADRKVIDEAPSILDHLCEPCAAHLEKVKGALRLAEIPFQIDAGLVRGLDYYTRTVYEIHHDRLGAQSALGGGGRYDRLVEDLGGPPTAGVGFSAGMERIASVAETLGLRWERREGLKIYAAPLAGEAEEMIYPLLQRLRQRWSAAGTPERRSLKNVLKHANRFGADLLLLLGEEELTRKTVGIKRLDTGEQIDVPLNRLEKEIERLEASIGRAGKQIEE